MEVVGTVTDMKTRIVHDIVYATLLCSPRRALKDIIVSFSNYGSRVVTYVPRLDHDTVYRLLYELKYKDLYSATEHFEDILCQWSDTNAYYRSFFKEITPLEACEILHA